MNQAELLESLSAQYRREQPAESEQLLRICCSIHLKARNHCYVNYMDKAQSLFTTWYLDQPKLNAHSARSYPAQPYPLVCICGAKYSVDGSYLQIHCGRCRGDCRKALIGAYDIQRLAIFCDINEMYLASVFAKVIYYGF